MYSDEEDEFNFNLLPKVPEDRLLPDVTVRRLDNGNLNNGNSYDMEFTQADIIETQGFQNKEFKDDSIIVHQQTFDRMTLKSYGEDSESPLGIMLGDFSEIEPLMTPVEHPGLENFGPNSSLKKLVIRPGTGKKVQVGQLVTAHMMISYEHGDDLLVSTFKDRGPIRFRVGRGEVITMIDIGVQTMRVGDEAKFLGEYNIAYGKMSAPILGPKNVKEIPGESRVMVHMEVLEIQAAEKNDAIAFMSGSERRLLDYKELFQYAAGMKESGNRMFREGDFEAAVKMYREALECCEDMKPMAGIEERKPKYIELCQLICNNLSQTYFKMTKYKLGLTWAKHASTLPGTSSNNAKSHYWAAKCLLKLADYKECLVEIKKADQLKPYDDDIHILLRMAEKKLSEQAHSEKILCERMMKISVKK